MNAETQYRWTSASSSHAGMVRQKNEDACLDESERGLWAVADGMGGHAFGELASSMVVDALEDIVPPDSMAGLVAAARTQLQSVNTELRAEAASRDVMVIGSTVVVLLAYGRRCACLWAGDSRLYLYRAGQLRQLTRDHSQAEEYRAKSGFNSDGLAPASGLRRVARNTITRAVGAADTLELEEEAIDACDGDMFLLCSDGLSNEVSELEICNALLPGDCLYASETLIDLALEHGGRDNISVIVVRAEDPDSDEQTVLNPALG
ncbi:PP2C family protein-serine/threonine phosphatase [Noviherbaspirillum autotrophicum]|uniref:PppA n=1 Tax=Noviherbaspirillum autotrophicum TaxID=709839 RepID=A0A0C2BJQ0_9BURK|nr:protein phosphatase 2C domain-containing protein [Noviherbaspirillum autotrophicum]KIF81415.1 PppA [Noviherbaspirillum autotrophicum]